MRGFSRRGFLRAGGGLVAVTGGGSLLAACSALSTAPQTASGPTGSGRTAKEAPMLASLVKEGKLPPVAKRLPSNPAVLKPLKEPGLYGGTLRRAVTTPTSSEDGYNIPSYAGLLEWEDQGSIEVVPALVESWTPTDQGATWTFKLRQGVRWSDGQPFTADDLVFVVQSIFGNATLTPVFPTYLTVDGKPARIVKVDDHTVRYVFGAPNGLFPEYMAYLGAAMVAPRHYLMQFHPDFTPMAQVAAAAKNAGFSTWDQYFQNQMSPWTNPACPVLGAWRVTTAMTGSNSQAVLERNPYYWKVDSQGRQLPYIDHITVDLIEDQQTLALRAANGEIDWQDQQIYFGDVTVMIKNAKQNGYRVLRWGTDAPWIAMYTNQSHLDPVMRKLMQNLNFRAALSLAIDRKAMNNALFAGQGGVTQPCGIAPDPYYEPKFGHSYIDHDPSRAASLLDQAGLSRKDGQGYRLRPDGKPLSLTILTFPFETGVNAVDAYQYVVRYWQHVGVRTNISSVSESLWANRVQAGQYDIAGYTVAGLLWEIDPEWYVPTGSITYWAPLFGLWYATNGASGEEPPPEIHRLQTLYNQMKSAVDKNVRLGLGRQILEAHNRNVWIIGSISQPFQPFIVNSDLTNVMENGIDSYRLGHSSIAKPDQLSYLHPSRH